MKKDLYLKAVLTVIAACMLINLFKETDLVPKAQAAGSFNPVAGYGLVPVNPDGTINVKLSGSDVLKVSLESVSSNAFWSCTVPVKQASSSDPINVNIKSVNWGAYDNTTLNVRMKQ